MPGMKIDVLDHGLVRLVDFMGNDESVVHAAAFPALWPHANWEIKRNGASSVIASFSNIA